MDEEEDAKGYIVIAEEAGGAGEVVEGHPFVQAMQCVGVGGFEAHGDFELAWEHVAEGEAGLADKQRVGFDDDFGEAGEARGNGGVIGRWDRVGVEEAAGVIEFYVARGRKRGEGVVDLSRDGAGGTGCSVVLRQRSHITHFHGHSRLVRKIVETRTILPVSSGSCSERKA